MKMLQINTHDILASCSCHFDLSFRQLCQYGRVLGAKTAGCHNGRGWSIFTQPSPQTAGVRSIDCGKTG